MVEIYLMMRTPSRFNNDFNDYCKNNESTTKNVFRNKWFGKENVRKDDSQNLATRRCHNSNDCTKSSNQSGDSGQCEKR